MIEPLLELAVLVVAAGRAASVVAMPAARRELREHPALAAGLGVAVLAGVLVITWSATHALVPLRVITIVVAVAWLVLAIRARPDHGRRRGRPPGALALRTSLAAIVDGDFYATAFRRYGPVFKMAQFHRPVVCVLGLGAGRALLRRYGDALRPPPVPLSTEVPRGFLRYMAPADHARYAKLFRAAVSEAALRAIEPCAVAETTRTLVRLTEDSHAANGGGVCPHDAIAAGLHGILLRLYFGAMLQPGDVATIAGFGRDADVGDAVGRPAARAVRALRGFEAWLRARSAAYDASSDPSIWGSLVRLDAATARDRTVAGNLFILLQASAHSIGGMLRWMLVLLGGATAWRDRVRTAAPAADDDPYARAVLETLRLAQSEYVYREVTAPISIADFTIPRGWLLRICVAESHRLPSVFDRPDAFDPDRHRARQYGVDDLSPFGLDLHACLGARMTLLVGRTFARQLVEGFEWDVLANGPKERANRHWHHWEPSARFRIALRRREDGSP